MVRVVVHTHLSIRSDRQEERRKEMTLEEMHYYLMDDQQFSSDTLTLHYNKAEFAASNQVRDTQQLASTAQLLVSLLSFSSVSISPLQ